MLHCVQVVGPVREGLWGPATGGLWGPATGGLCPASSAVAISQKRPKKGSNPNLG